MTGKSSCMITQRMRYRSKLSQLLLFQGLDKYNDKCTYPRDSQDGLLTLHLLKNYPRLFIYRSKLVRVTPVKTLQVCNTVFLVTFHVYCHSGKRTGCQMRSLKGCLMGMANNCEKAWGPLVSTYHRVWVGSHGLILQSTSGTGTSSSNIRGIFPIATWQAG